jgi:hypothetical protein
MWRVRNPRSSRLIPQMVGRSRSLAPEEHAGKGQDAINPAVPARLPLSGFLALRAGCSGMLGQWFRVAGFWRRSPEQCCSWSPSRSGSHCGPSPPMGPAGACLRALITRLRRRAGLQAETALRLPGLPPLAIDGTRQSRPLRTPSQAIRPWNGSTVCAGSRTGIIPYWLPRCGESWPTGSTATLGFREGSNIGSIGSSRRL